MANTLAKKLASVKPGTLYVGTDLVLDRNFAVVLNERAERLDRFGFPNDRQGYDYLHCRLAAIRERHQASTVLVGMEPTSYFWKLLAADLEQHQTEYRLVNAFARLYRMPRPYFFFVFGVPFLSSFFSFDAAFCALAGVISSLGR
jgi:hypothetical protein